MLSKDPNEVVDFTIDWAADLGDDTVSTSAFTLVTPAALVKDSESNTTTTSTVWLSGGTNGLIGQVRGVITTAGGRTFRRTLDIDISDPAALPLGALPISVAAVKVRLDIETGDLDPAGEAAIDAQVLGALRAAVEYVEGQSLRILRKREMVKTFNCWPVFPVCISGSPMRDIASITYLDDAGISQTLDADSWDWVPTADGAQVFLTDQPFSAPKLRYGHPQAVQFNFVAGYDPVGTVPRVEVYALPSRLEQAVVMMTGHLFTNRDAVGTERAYEVPLGVENLMINARLYR